MSAAIKIKRALISVSDKTGIVEFAKQLIDMDVEIISTGGTASLLSQANLPIIEVSDYTKFPEMMAGRVKTLHPKIHGGLLHRREIDDAIMQEHQIGAIDLLIVNLYPFKQTVSQPHCSFSDAIENIDIGGPTMLRAAAKNHDAVSVIVDPQDYTLVGETLNENNGEVSAPLRFYLAKKVFSHTADYDAAISNYLGQYDENHEKQTFPQTFTKQFCKKQDLRYGENPHQKAAFYVEAESTAANISTATQLQGKELSFNNIADTDAALECVKEFKEKPACVIVKHANPCGVALADDQLQAYQNAFSTDPTSSFGGIIAFNTELSETTAKKIIEQQFVEVIIAPSAEEAAIETLQQKQNVRLLTCGDWSEQPEQTQLNFKRVRGGLLVQDNNNVNLLTKQLQTVSKRAPTEQEMQDLLFAWTVAKYVKSNAIVYVKDQRTIGVGAGQMSRVYSAKIAGIKAQDEKLSVPGSVMASDAFFPFRDGIDAAAAAGITAIIQPGGSIRDEEVIKAADEANIAMIFTGVRHFLH